MQLALGDGLCQCGSWVTARPLPGAPAAIIHAMRDRGARCSSAPITSRCNATPPSAILTSLTASRSCSLPHRLPHGMHMAVTHNCKPLTPCSMNTLLLAPCLRTPALQRGHCGPSRVTVCTQAAPLRSNAAKRKVMKAILQSRCHAAVPLTEAVLAAPTPDHHHRLPHLHHNPPNKTMLNT